MIKETETGLLEAFSPRTVVLHQVNCMGIAESGTAAAIRARFPGWYDDYRAYCSWFKAGAFQSDHTAEIMGTFHRFEAGERLIVCSAFTRRGPGTASETDWGAWAKVLRRVEHQTRFVNGKLGLDWAIHAPADLGGGDEAAAREVLEFYFANSPVEVYLHQEA